MSEKTCCVTGHREIPEDKKEYVTAELKKEIMTAVENGYTRFISGFAEGVDLTFAAIVAELKEQGQPLILEAAIPYRNRLKSKDTLFQEMLSVCDKVTVVSETSSRSCYYARNRYMADESSIVIAVHDGREKGGTFYTIKYARTHDRTVRLISI